MDGAIENVSNWYGAQSIDPENLAQIHPQFLELFYAQMNKQINSIGHIFPYPPFIALTLLVGRQEGLPACKKAGCWFVDGDISTAALHVLQCHCCYHDFHHT